MLRLYELKAILLAMKFNPVQRRSQMLRRIIKFSASRPKRVVALWFVVALALASIGAGFGYKVVSDDRAVPAKGLGIRASS